MNIIEPSTSLNRYPFTMPIPESEYVSPVWKDGLFSEPCPVLDGCPECDENRS